MRFLLLFLIAFSLLADAPTERCRELYARVLDLTRRPLTPAQTKAFEKRWAALDKKRESFDWKATRGKSAAKDAWKEIDLHRLGASRTVQGKWNQKMKTDADVKAQENWERAARTVLRWIKNREPITERKIKGLNTTLSKGLTNDHDLPAGKYRTSHIFAGGKAERQYVRPALVPSAMRDFFTWYERAEKELHPIELAAKTYERIVAIHPFPDGNGRTARLVMDWVLESHGYPPAAVAGDWESSAVGLYAGLSDKENVPPSRVIETVTAGVEKSFELLEVAENKK